MAPIHLDQPPAASFCMVWRARTLAVLLLTHRLHNEIMLHFYLESLENKNLQGLKMFADQGVLSAVLQMLL